MVQAGRQPAPVQVSAQPSPFVRAQVSSTGQSLSVAHKSPLPLVILPWALRVLAQVLPSSHASPPSTTPLPQLSVQTLGDATVQVHPASTTHTLLQPSPEFASESSHCSPLPCSNVPSPHTASDRQAASHPSRGNVFLSSHSSPRPASTKLSPQFE